MITTRAISHLLQQQSSRLQYLHKKSLSNLPGFIGGCSNCSESIQGIENTTITAIIVPLSCVISFIIGALIGAVVHYRAVRKKRTVDMRERPTVALRPDTEYEVVSDIPSAGSINLRENAAYAHVQH